MPVFIQDELKLTEDALFVCSVKNGHYFLVNLVHPNEADPE